MQKLLLTLPVIAVLLALGTLCVGLGRSLANTEMLCPWKRPPRKHRLRPAVWTARGSRPPRKLPNPRSRTTSHLQKTTRVALASAAKRPLASDSLA